MHRIARVVLPWLVCAFALPAVAHEGLPAEVAELSVAIQKAPRNVELLLRRAEALRLNRNFSAALTDLKRAQKLQPDNEHIDLMFGVTYFEQDAMRQAISHLSRYLETYPSSFRAHWLRGAAYKRLGQHAKARVDLDRAVELGASVDVYLARGEVLQRLDDLSAAARNYRQGLKRLGGAVVLREKLVEVEAARGRHDLVIEALTPLIESAPVKTRWLLRRAEAHEARQDRRRARADREAALADAERLVQKRRSPAALRERARAYIALGRYQAAIVDLEEAIARAPKLTHAHALLQQARLAREEVSR